MEWLGITNSTLSTSLSVIKVLSVIISIGSAIGLVVVLHGIYSIVQKKKERWEQHFDKARPKQEASPQQLRWQHISQLFSSKNPSDWRVAILDADSMLEQLVTAMGYQGDTFGDRLKAIHPSDVPWLQAAWDVHLVRNRLAHEGSTYRINERDVYRIFKTYESIFYTTGYLR